MFDELLPGRRGQWTSQTTMRIDQKLRARVVELIGQET